MSTAKADTVPGLGFKDKDKALETIKNLEGRDPDYQKLAIKGLIGRAKRVLTLTKDKEKLQNINDAMSTFEKWLTDYEINNLAKENRAYLPLATIKALSSLTSKYSLENEENKKFLEAYEKAGGEYKNLRTVESGENEKTWDIVRNSKLKEILNVYEKERPDLWEDDLPTEVHLQMILWGYSPDASKIKKNLDKIKEKLGSTSDSNEKKKTTKRKSGDTSSSSSDEEKKKKKK